MQVCVPYLMFVSRDVNLVRDPKKKITFMLL